MTDEDFLTRWSRRKRAAEEPAKAEPPPAPDAAATAPDEAAATMPDESEEFDLTSLPPIESITETSDISVFLRKGVPAELTRAALRRAWLADPAIRDFIGLAENAWDFNEPNAMHGFGPLDYSPEQIRQMADEVTGGVRRVADKLAELADTPAANDSKALASERDDEPASIAAEERPEPSNSEPSERLDNTMRQDRNGAPQQNDPPLVNRQRRNHGGALPQ